MTEQRFFVEINGHCVGAGYPTYVVAEISCNHHKDFNKAVAILRAAKQAGADAVKLQTYTPDTITLNSKKSYFEIKGGNTWGGRTLYDLYQEAYTPWEWQPRLKKIAQEEGIDLFSSPFDPSAVDFLEDMGVPAYKVSSFEIVDIPLIQKIAKTGKPIILSTGLATFEEISEAVQAARDAGAGQIVVLKCTSDYPALPRDMNLSAIPYLSKALKVPTGLSDHTRGVEIAQAAVALGACMIEKHLILARADGGPDVGFSLEPDEFRQMVQGIRAVEEAIGNPTYILSPREENNRCFRRSLFIVAQVKAGELFTEKNVRSVRPSNGLPPKYLSVVLGKRAARDIERGTPLSWDLVESERKAEHAESTAR